MKTASAQIFLFCLLLTLSVCARAGDKNKTAPGPTFRPPTGTTHWKQLVAGPVATCSQPPCQPEARGWHGPTVVYSPPPTNELILFAGRNSAEVNLNDVWILYNANGNGSTNLCASGYSECWAQAMPSGGPPMVRSGHSAVYDPQNDRMIIFGGCNGFCEPTLNDVWVLINASTTDSTWMQLCQNGGGACGTPPGARTRAAMVYDPNSNEIIIFGGQTGGGSGGDTYSDTWVLRNANGLGGNPQWVQLSTSGTPAPGQYGPSGVYDVTHNILIVFGGGQHGTGINTNQVSTLSFANGMGGTPTWTQLSISGSAPAPRAFHTAVYDQASNIMTIFGGNNSGPIFSDTWLLSTANGMGGAPAWTEVALPNGPLTSIPTARDAHTAAYDSSTNIMMMFGGSGSGYDGWFVAPWTLLDASGQ